jgi:type IV secretion system protein VirD4
MEMLSKGVGYLAGYNLRFLTIAQSIGQLNDIYGRDAARAFATNHAAQIVFAPREQHDANEYSEMLGFLTDVSVSRGTSSGAGRSGAGRSTNRSEARRALMLPQELKEMGEARQIVLYERCKPVLADKIFYYRDPVLSKRLLPAPPVPRIDIDLVIARAQGRVRPATADDLGSSSRELASRLAHNFADLPPVSDGMTREQQVAFVRAFFDAMPTVDGRLEAAPDTQGEAGASALADAGSGDGGEGRQVAAKPDLGVELMSAG